MAFADFIRRVLLVEVHDNSTAPARDASGGTAEEQTDATVTINAEVHDSCDATDEIEADPIRNGIRASQLLHDPLIKACFANVRASYLRRFEDIPHGDVDRLQQVHLSLIALKDVHRALLAYEFNGQTAQRRASADAPRDAVPLRPMRRAANGRA